MRIITGNLSVGDNIELLGNASDLPVANTLYKDNIVKGWIQFDGTGAIAIRDSFNIDSIIDDGTGLYTINWDTGFANKEQYAAYLGL